MTSREDVHRLLNAVPETRLPALEQILRASLDGPAPQRFASAGTLSAEHDLAEQSEDILREAPSSGGAPGGRSHVIVVDTGPIVALLTTTAAGY